MNRVISIRLPDRLLEAVDSWSGEQLDAPNRTEAIKRLLAKALTADAGPSVNETIRRAEEEAERQSREQVMRELKGTSGGTGDG